MKKGRERGRRRCGRIMALAFSAMLGCFGWMEHGGSAAAGSAISAVCLCVLALGAYKCGYFRRRSANR